MNYINRLVDSSTIYSIGANNLCNNMLLCWDFIFDYFVHQDMVVLYDSLQLAHKCILNSFYGYVMRK